MFGRKLKSPLVEQALEPPEVALSERRKSTIEKHAAQIPFEITKIKNNQRVVIKRGKIGKDKRWIYWPKVKGYYWNNLSELDEIQTRKNRTDMKLIFDVDYCEPFDSNFQIKRSPEVERCLINQSMDDFSDVVALKGFELTTKHIMIMLLVAFLFLPFGLSLNAMFHIVPDMQVHWLPSLPHFGG